MFKTELLNSFYIIRGKTSTFKKKQQKMEKHKKTDKTFFISLDSLKRRNFKKKTNELKENGKIKNII